MRKGQPFQGTPYANYLIGGRVIPFAFSQAYVCQSVASHYGVAIESGSLRPKGPSGAALSKAAAIGARY